MALKKELIMDGDNIIIKLVVRFGVEDTHCRAASCVTVT